MKKVTIAIVGRPNVGKSTLFNRLIGHRRAIVHDLPGITRDRLYGEGAYRGRLFTLIDTGGLESMGDDSLFGEVEKQAEFAIDQADIVILLMDIRQGVLPKDRQLAEILRRSDKLTVPVLNKADTPRQFLEAAEFYALGMGEPVSIAAEHGKGTGDLMERLLEILPDWEETVGKDRSPAVKVSVIGRPNVGKSSFINRVLQDERVIVSDTPGTTRDPIDIGFTYDNRGYVFTDTAGIRRKGKVSQAVEKFSVIKALQGLKETDIALVLIDAAEGITDQDLTIAGYAEKEGCAVIILINKWDLVKGESRRKSEYVKNRFKFMPYAPVKYISALKGENIESVLQALPEIYAQYSKRVATPDLNRMLKECLASHPPSMVKGARLKIYYITQPQTCPPGFLLFMNRTKALHFSYLRFLKNRIRKQFGFEGSPIKIIIRGRNGKLQ
ncbi:MAG: ribosome biogenesis GTPase Der [bacterium]